MKLFQTVLEKFEYLGICSTPQPNKINKKIILTYVINGFALISTCLYLFYDANAYEDYAMGIYMFGAAMFVLFAFLGIHLNSKKMFALIEKLEKVVEKSE